MVYLLWIVMQHDSTVSDSLTTCYELESYTKCSTCIEYTSCSKVCSIVVDISLQRRISPFNLYKQVKKWSNI